MWVLLLIAAIVLSGALIRLDQENQQLDKQTKQQFELYRKEVEQKQLNTIKDFNAEQQRQREDLDKQIQQLKHDLEARKAHQNVLAAKLVPQAQAATNTAYSGSGSSSDAKMWIYMHESGNRPTARNSGGCLGLGQACPGSKLLAVCPDLNDYACQDSFFTSYMTARYGTWDNAKAFWLAHNWW